MIQVKDIDVFISLLQNTADPILVLVLKWIEKEFGILYVTEFFRIQKHPNDLHGLKLVRATDLRSAAAFNPQEMADKINRHWIYDPKRPDMKCCVYHDSGSGLHFHIQVHPNTVSR